jgi:ribose 5-phosphate isomerase B
MLIAIGANHHGYQVREMLIELLRQSGHEVLDLGVRDDRPVDYPDVAATVARKVARKEADRGILISGTGLGMCIAANKVAGVRAVLCHDGMTAEMSRRHNDANVLCLAAGMLGESFIRHIVATWLKAPFDGGCYAQQVKKIASLEHGGRPQNGSA